MEESDKKLHETHTCLVCNGIAKPKHDKTFWIIVVNFCDTKKRLLVGQNIARAVPRPSNITEVDIIHCELLGLVDDKTTQLYRKRIINVRDTSVVNDYLRDNRNSHMAVDEKKVIAEDIDLSDVAKKQNKSIRTM